MTAESALKAAVEICKRYKAQRVILFGSRAKGTHTERSDLDLRERDLRDSFVLSGTGARFCITLDLAWKVMKG